VVDRRGYSVPSPSGLHPTGSVRRKRDEPAQRSPHGGLVRGLRPVLTIPPVPLDGGVPADGHHSAASEAGLVGRTARGPIRPSAYVNTFDGCNGVPYMSRTRRRAGRDGGGRAGRGSRARSDPSPIFWKRALESAPVGCSSILRRAQPTIQNGHGLCSATGGSSSGSSAGRGAGRIRRARGPRADGDRAIAATGMRRGPRPVRHPRRIPRRGAFMPSSPAAAVPGGPAPVEDDGLSPISISICSGTVGRPGRFRSAGSSSPILHGRSHVGHET
jgi:hypothetical protein